MPSSPPASSLGTSPSAPTADPGPNVIASSISSTDATSSSTSHRPRARGPRGAGRRRSRRSRSALAAGASRGRCAARSRVDPSACARATISTSGSRYTGLNGCATRSAPARAGPWSTVGAGRTSTRRSARPGEPTARSRRAGVVEGPRPRGRSPARDRRRDGLPSEAAKLAVTASAAHASAAPMPARRSRGLRTRRSESGCGSKTTTSTPFSTSRPASHLDHTAADERDVHQSCVASCSFSRVSSGPTPARSSPREWPRPVRRAGHSWPSPRQPDVVLEPDADVPAEDRRERDVGKLHAADGERREHAPRGSWFTSASSVPGSSGAP